MECQVCKYKCVEYSFNIHLCMNCGTSYKIINEELYVMDSTTHKFIKYYTGGLNEIKNMENNISQQSNSKKHN